VARGGQILSPLLVLVAGVTLGCGESKRAAAPPPAPIPFVDLGGEALKSGTRLRAISFVSEEGLRVPTLRFLDTERGEECSFQPSAAGDYRCYPDADLNYPFEYFDADCRTPAFLGCNPYAELRNSATCSDAIAGVYELGAAIDGAPVSTGCSQVSVDPGVQYRRIGARIPDAVFVRASVDVAEDGNRIDARQLSADDGSGLLLGFFDHVEDKPCDLATVNTGSTLCYPPPFSLIHSFFEDQTCSGSGRRLGIGSCEPPSVGYDSNAGAFYRLGASVGQVPPFVAPTGDPATCLASSTAWQGYEVGDAIAASAFEALERATIGDARVELGVARTLDGRVVVPDPVRQDDYLSDTELGVECRIETASDGELRCLPVLYGTDDPSLFADDTCEVPLAAFLDRTDLSEPTWLVMTNTSTDAGCAVGSTTKVYDLAAQPFTGTRYHWTTDDAGNLLCSEDTSDRPELRLTVGEIDPARFVRFDRVSD
jgi:hypothetical protein